MPGMWEVHHRGKHTKQQGRLYMIIQFFHLDKSINSTSNWTSCLSQELLKNHNWFHNSILSGLPYLWHCPLDSTRSRRGFSKNWHEPDLLVAHLQTFRCSENLHSQEVKENRRKDTYQVTHIIEQARNSQELAFPESQHTAISEVLQPSTGINPVRV